MNPARINIDGHETTVWIFKNRDKRLAHGFKHFLDLRQPWHSLENVKSTAHDRLMMRRTVGETKCAGEYHSRINCPEYSKCTSLLTDFTGDYIRKIIEVINETVNTGAAFYLRDNHQCVFLSSEGVFALAWISHNRHHYWNIVTCYLPYDRRFESVSNTTAYERFFVALDQVFLKFIQPGRCGRTMNPELWDNYIEVLLKRNNHNE